jgi:pyruvate,water dikinase
VLTAEQARRRDLAGGKGAVLAELANTFPVPPFFVIPPDALAEGLPPAAREAITDAARRLGPGPYAVRSSGVEEDGAAAAHAGQFDTQLNVPLDGLAEAVQAVWRSGFSDTLAAYRRAHGLSGAPQPPAVVVQVMLHPEAAGVAFTADPVTGDTDVAIVSAVAGLADRLVAGEVDGDVYRVGPDGELLDADPQGALPILTPAQAAAVAALARRAEAHFGAPQDIEWAIQDGSVRLLQARPITTLPASADPAVTLWDNSNIVESYPGVVSPLTFSFARRVYGHAYRAFAELMGVPEPVIAANRAAFEAMLGRAHGRVYYNLLAWYRLLSLFPGFKANRAFMEQMMGVGEPLPASLARRIAPETPPGLARVADRLRLARVGAGLVFQALVLPRTIRRFYARLETALARSDAEIVRLPASALAAEYRSLEAQLLERWDAPLVNDFLCMIAFGASRKALERWAGAEGLALHSEALIGQGDIISAEPARRIRTMGAAARDRPELQDALERGDLDAARADATLGPAIDSYLARFGDRCTEELKLESATLHEEPWPLLSAIAAAARSRQEHRDETAADPFGRLDALLANRPLRRPLARALLRWAKARVRDRENLRFERTRLFGRVRRLVWGGGERLAEAGVLTSPDDVFFLTIEEWLGALEGGVVGRDLKGVVEVRRREDREDRARSDPPERFEIRGAFLVGLPSLRSRTKIVEGDPHLRMGQGCCAGVVTARVRVVDDPRRQALDPGEILVARHTDPGWIAVFANAAGVIAERGSLLSHSAIVAREMGVPCVVALKGATEWLKTGDVVRLDGGAGTVERVDG